MRRAGFTLIELMVTVTIIGVLAATAIPAFMKYTRKAKTSEARQQIRKIYDGARAYFFDPNVAGVTQMNAVERQYPDGTVVTPVFGACCATSGSTNVKCGPNDAWWDVQPWRHLQFAMPDPHYYRYAYLRIGGNRYFHAYAEGDLDCDNFKSVFTMYGDVNQGEPYGTSKILRQNELE